MKRDSIYPVIAAFIAAVCAGCGRPPGQPGPYSEVIPPSQIADFHTLFSQNCAGCHGRDGKGGAAISLSDPVFLAVADDAAIRGPAVRGVPGTPMPAFAQSAGGMLTDKQIDVIVGGIRSWSRPETLRGENLPPYAAESPGDPAHGADVYATYCSSCHGSDGEGGSKAGSIVNGSYLALASDQNLRTTVIAGVPDQGAPDWRNDVPGKPMSSSEISDVVAWLAAQRPQFPGQPFQSALPNQPLAKPLGVALREIP